MTMNPTSMFCFRREIRVKPLTLANWIDFEKLFGALGACDGCWCMWWRLKRSVFLAQKGERNKRSLKAIVRSGECAGILAYHQERPIGWCAVGPRESFPSLDATRYLKKVNDLPVWSIVCFFVDKTWRRRGVTVALIEAAIEYAKAKGAYAVEGYPVELLSKRTSRSNSYMGIASAFRKAGFVDVLRRVEHRPIMRFYCQGR
jgi:GNAT superfamily N-acetyltransferase